jgi:hypothetical protein
LRREQRIARSLTVDELVRSPKTATASPSSQFSFSIVTGSTSCCAKYTSHHSPLSFKESIG